MTLDEAIERYTNNAEYERTHSNLQGCLDFRQLAEWLAELKQLRERARWIPVSEWLPEDRLYVLATYKYEYGLIDHGITWYGKAEDRWNASREVIAWMPLPEPYKAESEESDASSN